MPNFYLGCDVSKGYADFIILDSDKKIIEPVFQLDDTFEGHNRFFNFLQDFFNRYPGSTLYCAVESTGGLENNWLALFKRLADILSIKSARINPVGPNALHKASLTRNSDDAISAKLIAEYLITYPEKVNYDTDDPYISLRKQWNLLEMYKKQKTQLLNQLNINLYTAMPFLMKHTRNGIPNWLLQLLYKYPASSQLAKAKQTSLVNIPYLSHKRACTLISEAKQSIGSANDQTTAFLIKSLVKQVLHLSNLIKQHRLYMLKDCILPEVKLLYSFTGIGVYSAIGLVLNIVSVDRFPSAKHLSSYFGVHPVYKRSGDGSWAFRMSKQGRRAPRQILYMVARCAIVYNPLIKEVYINHLKKGMCKSAALGACMHKILRIVFGILKHQKEFDPEIDKQNRNKTRLTGKVSNKPELKRRYQENAEDAPVSRRQSIKRRKRKQSQNLLEV